MPHDKLWLLSEMAEAALSLSRSKSASTPRTPGLHWDVAWMYTEPKLVDPVYTCFFCHGTPHIACHECKVLHCTFDLCQSGVLDCADCGWPTLLLLLLLLLLLILLLLTPIAVCGSVASGLCGASSIPPKC